MKRTFHPLSFCDFVSSILSSDIGMALDIIYSDLEFRIFQPYQSEFDVKLPIETLQALTLSCCQGYDRTTCII